jgi:type I restriction enzyme S subunit
MAWKKYKLGDLIELCDERNTEGKYTLDDVMGISTDKAFIETKANMNGVVINSYKVVGQDEFAYVADTSRRGDKIALAYNNRNKRLLISSIYTVFRVRRSNLLFSNYLFIFFNRPEFDRYSRFNSWGSARETFSWDDFCDIELPLPSLEVQKQYATVYQAACDNMNVYQSRLDSLKTVCDGYIERLRTEIKPQKIGNYIEPRDERNSELKIKLAQGITNDKHFATPKQVAQIETNAKIVRRDQFAYNRATTRNGDKISIAYRTDEDCVVSSAYGVFEIVKKNQLLAEYLMIWFKRSEFDRYARYMSKGSAHEFFEYDDMCDVEIPIPSMDIQRDIVNIYQCYIERQRIAAQMKEQIKALCPVLIRGSLQE